MANIHNVVPRNVSVRISYRIWSDGMAHPVVQTFKTDRRGLVAALRALQSDQFRAERAITAVWYTDDEGSVLKVVPC